MDPSAHPTISDNFSTGYSLIKEELTQNSGRKEKMEKGDSPVFVELLFTVSFAAGEARSFPAGWTYSLKAHFHFPFLTLNYAFCILIIG